jgi:Xaa-Pro aminopeptidase
MLRQFALQEDVQRRIKKAQAMMKTKGLGALFIPAQGAPGMMGMAKYFTNLQLWAGTAWVVVGSEHPEPALIQSSSYGMEWNKQEATTSWIESPYPDPLGRAIEICKEFSERDKSIGIVNLKTTWKVGEWTRVQQELLVDGRETIDVTKDINKMRSIKSIFEIEEIYRTGRLLCEGLERFSEVARPGIRCWDAAAAAEQVLRSQGCFWGRSKYSLDLRPQTIPTPLDKRFAEDDIILFELVYTGTLGYWHEMTALFSFKPLPEDVQRQLEAQEKVIQACSNAMKAGARIGDMHDVASEVWKQEGFEVIGRHTPNCHSIGLDDEDGPSSWFTPDEILEPNMVLSFHPSTLLKGNRAFLISDNFLVTSEGAVPLSPREWVYRKIDP